MSSPLRMDVTFLLVAIAVTWVCGLRIGFPGFSVSQHSFIQHPKRTTCPENSCNLASPFQCGEIQTCIRLFQVCNGYADCDNGFDEDLDVCATVFRPFVCAIREFLVRHGQWILPKFFNNADPALVAPVLHGAYTMEDLQSNLNLTDQNIENIHNSMIGVIEGDPRPLLALGMPERAWPEVRYLLEDLNKLGLDV